MSIGIEITMVAAAIATISSAISAIAALIKGLTKSKSKDNKIEITIDGKKIDLFRDHNEKYERLLEAVDALSDKTKIQIQTNDIVNGNPADTTKSAAD